MYFKEIFLAIILQMLEIGHFQKVQVLLIVMDFNLLVKFQKNYFYIIIYVNLGGYCVASGEALTKTVVKLIFIYNFYLNKFK